MHEIEQGGVRYWPATSFLGHTAPLRDGGIYPVLGIPFAYRSNSPTVLSIVEETLGHWRTLAPTLVASLTPRRVALLVHPAPSQTEERLEPFTYRFHSDIMIAASGENLFTAHYRTGEALASVTPELVAHDLHFRYNVVESVALAMTMTLDRTAIHAAGVVRNGRTVLLLGRSRAGKSTLCYACLRAGFQLLAEDVVYVALRPTQRLWGGSGRLHLLPDAPRLFPELASLAPQVQANGKVKLAVPIAPTQRRLYAEGATICLLERHEGRDSTLEPLDPACLTRFLCEGRESGFDLYPNVAEVAAALAHAPTYRLSVGHALDEAVARLMALTDAAR